MVESYIKTHQTTILLIVLAVLLIVVALAYFYSSPTASSSITPPTVTLSAVNQQGVQLQWSVVNGAESYLLGWQLTPTSGTPDNFTMLSQSTPLNVGTIQTLALSSTYDFIVQALSASNAVLTSMIIRGVLIDPSSATYNALPDSAPYAITTPIPSPTTATFTWSDQYCPTSVASYSAVLTNTSTGVVIGSVSSTPAAKTATFTGLTVSTSYTVSIYRIYTYSGFKVIPGIATYTTPAGAAQIQQ